MRTIAFYSYKGGTSRSLLLVNFARFLAKGNQSVVILDFDLEAPGLHHKLLESGNLSKQEWKRKRETAGLQEYLKVYEASSNNPESREAPQDLQKYFMELQFKDCKKPCYFMPAGNAPTVDYAARHLSRNWKEYFPREKGQEPFGLNLFLNLRNRVKDELGANFLLIDERTGLTDIGANLLLFIPDTAVCLFLSNKESLAGTRLMLETIRDLNKKESMSLTVVPVLTRIPNDNRERKDAIDNSKKELGDLCDWDTLSVLHEQMSLHVYEEILFGSTKSLRESVLLRDYIELFKHLEPSILAISRVSALNKYLPSWRGSKKCRGDHGVNSLDRKGISIRDMVVRVGLMSYVPVYFHTGLELHNMVQAMAGHMANIITKKKPEVVPEDRVNWNYLANQMRSGNYAFCGEPYYLTRFRGLSSGVIKIGQVETFTCFVRRNSKVGMEFEHILAELKNEHGPAERRISEAELVNIVEKLNARCNDELSIGTMGETPASDVIPKRLSSIICGGRLEFKPNADSLWNWLNDGTEEDDKRLVICDHVLGKKLLKSAGGDEAAKDYIFQYTSENVRNNGPEFEYEEPIPAGFMYPIDDVLWRRFISNSLATVLCPENSAVPSFDWNVLRKELKYDGVEALDETELRKELIWDMDLDEAISLDSRLAKRIKDSAITLISKGGHGDEC